ncbi:stealth conserved region 3 domain-containing protein [Microbacterium sp. LjRoot45]|uniref:stealth conserved region 3 domain-containing protein n=1 Tax=Microbacterium sp. LjRoot45 TaxID=3342329 RepID=UPI003ECD8FD8
MTALQALPSHPHPWSGLLTRGDVVFDDGVFRLRHDDTTPGQALEADLLLVADALDAAGIAVTLIRHGSAAPALVVDAAQRDAVLGVLRALGEREPLYAKSAGAPVGLAADLEPSTEAASVGARSIRLYRPRISATGSLRYDKDCSFALEFWRRDGDVIHAPRANALTRRVFPASDLRPATKHRYGRSWATLEGMFDPQPDEVVDEIDLVFSWVDGSSSEFQRQRAAQMEGYVVGEGDESAARYRHVDELRYALRSVHMYAPWVRRIFIATDSPRPSWLADDPRVTLVRSEDFFADTSVLPTHNSHAVEAQLHRIDGLAERFLYSNDDMFFARPVRPELFFTSGGVSKFVECPIRIGTGDPLPHRSGHDNALRVNRALLRERFGRTILRDLEHCATPLRRSVLTELEREFPDDFARTAASRFRSATDISVTNSLYHYYALMTGRAVVSTEARVRYVQSTLASSLRQMRRLEKRRDVDMFCLNDGGSSEVPEDVRIRTVRDTLERMFPVRGPWELPEVGVESDADVSGGRAPGESAERIGASH